LIRLAALATPMSRSAGACWWCTVAEVTSERGQACLIYYPDLLSKVV
jgi:hypothetical protein